MLNNLVDTLNNSGCFNEVINQVNLNPHLINFFNLLIPLAQISNQIQQYNHSTWTSFDRLHRNVSKSTACSTKKI